MVRFRPVMLTAITTALSLLPTVLGFSLDVRNLRIARGGSSVEMWGPMANAVVSGLLVATFLTLVAVPAMYQLSESATDLAKRIWGHRVGRVVMSLLVGLAVVGFLKALFL
jgi:Cu/Ag efflux pump CusA